MVFSIHHISFQALELSVALAATISTIFATTGALASRFVLRVDVEVVAIRECLICPARTGFFESRSQRIAFPRSSLSS